MFASRRSTVLCSLFVAWSTFLVRSVRSWTSVVRTFDDRRCRPRRRRHRLLSVPPPTTTTTTSKTELRASADERDEDDDDDDEVRAAYRFAMEEDREWYEEFVLGKTSTKKVNGETPTKREDEAEEVTTTPLVASSASASATTTLGEIEDATPSDARDDASFAEQVVDDGYNAYGENLHDDYDNEVDKEVEEEEKENAPFDGDYYYDNDDDNVGLDKDDEKDEGATVAYDENEDATSARDGDGVARVALGKAERYVRVDGGTSSRWNDDDVLRGLGYSAEERAALSPEVADLLRQDRVRRPEAGVPPEWCDDRVGGVAENEARTGEDDAPSRARRRRDDYDYEDDERSPSPPRRRRRDGARSSSDSPSSSRRARRTRVADPTSRNRRRPRRDDAEDDPDVGLWPSRADFKRFLRQEARLRLAVLGPEWKDLVKSESVWRLNLYGKWLRLLEEGARNDDADADAFVVPNGARGGPPRRRPPGGPPRRRRRRTDDDDDEDDERAATRRRRRRRRPSPTREYASERDE